MHIGIVAVSAPGAALCYQTICAEGASFFGRHAHPEVTTHTYPLAEYMRHIGPVYPAKLAPKGIGHEIPAAEEHERINQLTFDELVYGRFETSTRSYFARLIAQAKTRGCDAVVLGCTEFPLLIGQADSALPVLDSTRILARAALREAQRAAKRAT